MQFEFNVVLGLSGAIAGPQLFHEAHRETVPAGADLRVESGLRGKQDAHELAGRPLLDGFLEETALRHFPAGRGAAPATLCAG